MLPKTRIKRIILTILVLALVWVVVYTAMIVREKKPFKQNEVALDKIAALINEDYPGARLYSRNQCWTVNMKYKSGPRSCENTKYLLLKAPTIEGAQGIMSAINKRINSYSPLDESQLTDPSLHEWYYNFELNKQGCVVAYRFYPPDKPELPFSSVLRLPQEEFSGLYAAISCGARSRWNYYPVYTPFNQ